MEVSLMAEGAGQKHSVEIAWGYNRSELLHYKVVEEMTYFWMSGWVWLLEPGEYERYCGYKLPRAE